MVTVKGGTAEKSFEGSPLNAVGKSGTGEMWGKDPVNWFIAWDESQEDPVIVLVMIEGAGTFEDGSELTAAPAVRNILESYYGIKESSRGSQNESPSEENQTRTGPIASRPPEEAG